MIFFTGALCAAVHAAALPSSAEKPEGFFHRVFNEHTKKLFHLWRQILIRVKATAGPTAEPVFIIVSFNQTHRSADAFPLAKRRRHSVRRNNFKDKNVQNMNVY